MPSWPSLRVIEIGRNCALIEKQKITEPDAVRESAMKKTNNLRSTFRRELQKINDSKRSGAGRVDIYVPSLWYFNDLIFLVDHETPDRSESTRDANRTEDSVSGFSMPAQSAYSILLLFFFGPLLTISQSSLFNSQTRTQSGDLLQNKIERTERNHNENFQ